MTLAPDLFDQTIKDDKITHKLLNFNAFLICSNNDNNKERNKKCSIQYIVLLFYRITLIRKLNEAISVLLNIIAVKYGK